MSKMFALLVVCAGLVQADQRYVTLRGELQVMGERPNEPYVVELTTVDRDLMADRITMRGSGSFEFRNVPAGNYHIRLLKNGEVIRQEFVNARSYYPPVRFNVRSEPRQEPVAGVVSVRTLAHEPPEKAKELFEDSNKLARKGKLEESLAKLKKAVSIDPEYMQAYNNLGTRLMELQRPEEALVALEKALDLEPGAARVLTNMAVAFMSLQRAADAEVAVRRAMELAPASDAARYILGLSLLSQNKNTEEAVENLNAVSDTYPKARLAAAQALVAAGSIDKARKELRSYLDAGKPEHRQDVEAWLQRLN